MKKPRVLFVCSHNSGRSQIAEELLRKYGGRDYEVESAGLEPRPINKLVIEVLKEEGIDISEKVPRDVFPLFDEGKVYTYVITVCSKQAHEACPLFPGVQRRINWPFPDPETFTGSRQEKLAKVRELKDSIKTKLAELFEIVVD